MYKYKKLESLEIDSNKDNTASNKQWYKRGVFWSVINWAQLTVISLLKSIRNLIDMAIAKIVSKESNVGNAKDLLVQEEEREMEAVENTLATLPSYKEAIKGGPPTYEETLESDKIKAHKTQLSNLQKPGELKAFDDGIEAEIADYKSYLDKWQAKGNSSSAQKSKERVSQWLKTQANLNKRSASVAGLDDTNIDYPCKRIITPEATLPSTGEVKSSVGPSVARSETSGYETEGETASSVSGFSNMSNILSHQAVTEVPSMSSEERVSEWLKTQANLNKRSASVAGLDSKSSVNPCKAPRNEVLNSVTLNAQNMKQMFGILDSMDRRIEKSGAIAQQVREKSEELFKEAHEILRGITSSVSGSSNMSSADTESLDLSKTGNVVSGSSDYLYSLKVLPCEESTQGQPSNQFSSADIQHIKNDTANAILV